MDQAVNGSDGKEHSLCDGLKMLHPGCRIIRKYGPVEVQVALLE